MFFHEMKNLLTFYNMVIKKKRKAEGFLGRVDAGHSALMGSGAEGRAVEGSREGWATGTFQRQAGSVRGLVSGPSFKSANLRRGWLE